MSLWSQYSLDNIHRLREMAGEHSSVQVINPYQNNFFGEKFETVSDLTLVVGDRFIVSEGLLMPCDAVLISGRAVMDESMLTGESIPVTKTPIELAGLGGGSNDTPLLTTKLTSNRSVHLDAVGSREDTVADEEEIDIAEKRAVSVLYGGTKVKHTVGECVSVCYRTGFRSAKGQLIVSLLKPRESSLNFFEDINWVFVVMFGLATLLFIYEGQPSVG